MGNERIYTRPLALDHVQAAVEFGSPLSARDAICGVAIMQSIPFREGRKTLKFGVRLFARGSLR